MLGSQLIRRSDGPRWRYMVASDLSVVEWIANLVHVGYPEDLSVLAERLTLYPAGCLVLDGRGGVIGYVMSHPWMFARPPELNSYLRQLPASPDTFYIHDMALMPDARGSGAGGAAVRLLAEQAMLEGLTVLSLIAVGRSLDFWQHQGFRVADDHAIAPKLLSYGEAAHHMVRQLA